MSKLKIVCFGEVLFDVFDQQKNIGGAPLNVALRLNSFGQEVSIISAVGKDKNGENIINNLKKNNLSINSIQINNHFSTGLVNVSLDKNRNATYSINYPSAWDNIKFTEDAELLVKESDILVYGSLVCRDIISRNTLFQLLKVAKFKVFDVNLRSPHYSEELIIDLMNTANLIKLNNEELNIICKFLGVNNNSVENKIKYIAKSTNTNTVCVTLGGKGAILFYNNKLFYNKGYKVNVVDTVGSGDSFLAMLVTKLFKELKPQEAIDLACAVGAIVAQNKGANPAITQLEIDKFLREQKII